MSWEHPTSGYGASFVGGNLVNRYTPERIRNVGLFSHGGAGKTSLAEAMLYDTKTITRLGRVEDGNTVCDFRSR